jgi:hypothetical protein
MLLKLAAQHLDAAEQARYSVLPAVNRPSWSCAELLPIAEPSIFDSFCYR